MEIRPPWLFFSTKRLLKNDQQKRKRKEKEIALYFIPLPKNSALFRRNERGRTKISFFVNNVAEFSFFVLESLEGEWKKECFGENNLFQKKSHQVPRPTREKKELF